MHTNIYLSHIVHIKIKAQNYFVGSEKSSNFAPLFGVTAEHGRVMDYVTLERQTIFN